MKEQKHTLDQLFALAKQQEPLLANERAHKIIQHAHTRAFPGKRLVTFFQNHVKILIMSTIVSSIFLGIFFGVHSSPDQVKEKVTVKSNGCIVETARDQGNLQTRQSNKPPREVSSKSSTLKQEANTLLQNLPKQIIGDSINILPQTNIQQPDTVFDGDDCILKLDCSEFMKLGLSVDNYAVYYLNFSGNIISGFNERRNGQYYYSRLDWRWVFNPRNNKDESDTILYTIKQPTFNPFYIKYITSKQFYYLTDGECYANSDVLDKPLVDSLLYCIKNKTLIYNSLIKNETFRDIIKNLDKSNLLYVYKHPNFSKFEIENDTLVPVTTNCQCCTKVYWFTANEVFYKTLPVRYSNKVRSFYEKVGKVKAKYRNDVDIVKYSSLYEIADKMKRTNTLKLSEEKLSKLGFRITQDTFTYFHSIFGLEYVKGDKKLHLILNNTNINSPAVEFVTNTKGVNTTNEIILRSRGSDLQFSKKLRI